MEVQVPCEVEEEPCGEGEEVACEEAAVPLEVVGVAPSDLAALDQVKALFQLHKVDYDAIHQDCYSSEVEDISDYWSHWQLLLLWRLQLSVPSFQTASRTIVELSWLVSVAAARLRIQGEERELGVKVFLRGECW